MPKNKVLKEKAEAARNKAKAIKHREGEELAKRLAGKRKLGPVFTGESIKADTHRDDEEDDPVFGGRGPLGNMFAKYFGKNFEHYNSLYAAFGFGRGL